MKNQSHQELREWIKDGIVIISSLGVLFLFLVKYYSLPTEVEAQAKEIKATQAQVSDLQTYTIRADGRMQRIEDGQAYTNKGIDDLKGWMKLISQRRTP